jgi:heme-degrading monooxygenase HmoA
MQPFPIVPALVLSCALHATACSSTKASEPSPEQELQTEPDAARDDLGGSGLPDAGNAHDTFAGCSKGELEPDVVIETPLTGPGVDAETGELGPGRFVIASTYLAVDPEQIEQAQQLGGAVLETLPQSKGLVAFSLTQSQSCASLRTLTVWETEEDMLQFVMSPAHVEAMSKVGQVSRGSSDTVSWQGPAGDAAWSLAAERLGAEQGGEH